MIKVVDLQKTYVVNRKEKKALDGVTFEVRQGEILGVIGHSGAGKSTLIRCLNGLEKPSKGSVYLDGIDITQLKGKKLREQQRKIGMVFQHFNLLSAKTVEENIKYPLRLEKKQSEQEMSKRVRELLELVGLEGYEKYYPAQLSGGQKQRVGIARALANEPKLLLCDEATSALDPQTTSAILSLLMDINTRLGMTILVITHEINVIRTICDRVIILDQGKLVEMGEVSQIFLHPQQQVTRDFLLEDNQFLDFDKFPVQALQNNESRILKVSFIHQQTYSPILFNLANKIGIYFNVLQGIVSQMKNTPYGQVVVEIQGNKAQLDEAILYLQRCCARVEVLRDGLYRDRLGRDWNCHG
jgi:D-methionine transport system ATP-binding protein